MPQTKASTSVRAAPAVTYRDDLRSANRLIGTPIAAGGLTLMVFLKDYSVAR
jgi:hypothetical protein